MTGFVTDERRRLSGASLSSTLVAVVSPLVVVDSVGGVTPSDDTIAVAAWLCVLVPAAAPAAASASSRSFLHRTHEHRLRHAAHCHVAKLIGFDMSCLSLLLVRP